MAIFLGIILALLGGAIGGYLFSIHSFITCKPLRDCWNEIADEYDD